MWTNHKKTKALTIYAHNKSAGITSKITNIPKTTIQHWVNEDKKSECSFVKQKSEEFNEQFINEARESVFLIMKLFKKKLFRALESEEEMDNVLNTLSSGDGVDNQIKKEILSKLKSIKLENQIGALSNYLSTLVDKSRVINDEATSIIRTEKKLEDYINVSID